MLEGGIWTQGAEEIDHPVGNVVLRIPSRASCTLLPASANHPEGEVIELLQGGFPVGTVTAFPGPAARTETVPITFLGSKYEPVEYWPAPGGPVRHQLEAEIGEPCEQGGELFSFEKLAIEVVGMTEDH
jgi:hypothetical protein